MPDTTGPDLVVALPQTSTTGTGAPPGSGEGARRVEGAPPGVALRVGTWKRRPRSVEREVCVARGGTVRNHRNWL